MIKQLKKLNSLWLSLIVSLSFCNGFTQTLKLKDNIEYNYTVGSDLIFKASSFTKLDSLIVIKSDLLKDSLKIKIDYLFFQLQDSNKISDILAGTFQYPGLYKITSYYLRKTADTSNKIVLKKLDSLHWLVKKDFDTIYFYIPSARKSQDEFPKSISAHLSFSSQRQDVQNIAENIKLFRDSCKLVFNKMLNIAPRIIDTFNLTTKKLDTVTLKPYNIDSFFYHKLNSFAADWAAKKIDSGKTVEGCFFVDFNTALTLINWKVDSADEQELLNSALLFRDAIFDDAISFWKADTLITDDATLHFYLDGWKQSSKLANLTDTLCFFKRKDDYLSQDILKKYLNKYSDGRSCVFFGYSDTYFDKLVIAFRLIGQKSLN